MFLKKKSPKSRKNYGKITAKTQQQMAVNSLNTRVQSPYSQFLVFTTIVTWRARFSSVKFWRWRALTYYWLLLTSRAPAGSAAVSK